MMEWWILSIFSKIVDFFRFLAKNRFFLIFFWFFSLDFCMSARRPIKKPQKQSKTGLLGIKCCLSLVLHQFSLVWKSNASPKSPSQPFPKVEKTEKFKLLRFFCVFPGINLSLFPRRPFEKPQKRLKTGLRWHYILSIVLVLCDFQFVNRMWCHNHLERRFPTSKKPQKMKKSLFWTPWILQR